MKRGRKLKTIEGLALRVHRVLRESGARNENVVRAMIERGMAEIGLCFEPEIVVQRVFGILFLRGIVIWKGEKRARRLAARSA